MSALNETWTAEEIQNYVGQLFIVGFHGHVPSPEIRTLITKHRVGSVILFQRNVQNPIQLLKLTSDLQTIAREAGHEKPLFIGIDQENGLITRIKEPIAIQLPGPMALAATRDVKDAYKVGRATAETLKHYGINFNYGPVADVNSEPRNPVIGVRSPSDDPQTTGRIVSASSKGLRDGGVIACVKHFPGHGDTAVDSHFGSPVTEKTWDQLDECELVPFRRAILEGVDAVMTAHIITPNLNQQDLESGHKLRQVPASLNPDVIAILRDEYGFDGLIVSDCLEMDAVRAKYGTVASAAFALQGGTDCAMICHTFSTQVSAIESIVEHVTSEQLPLQDIKRSAARVRSLKEKYRLSFENTSSNSPNRIFDDQRELAAEIYAKSTTLVRCNSSAFPLQPSLSNVLLITVGQSVASSGAVDSGDEDTESSVTGPSYTSIIEAISPSASLEVIEIELKTDIKLSSESESIIDNASAVILATRNALLDEHQKNFGLELGRRLGNKLVVIATCEPYDFLDDIAEISNYVTMYEPTLPAFKAAIDVIFGVQPALGQLPVKQPRIDHEKDMILVSPKNEEQVGQISHLWKKIFPTWTISAQRMEKLLQHEHGIYLIHPHGFCLAYLCEGMGKLTAVGVLPEYHNKGLGTAFIKRARKELDRIGVVKSWGIGSVFPRFWAGIPFDLDKTHGDFFLHQGFRKSTSLTARDHFRSIVNDVATPTTLERVAKLEIDFVPWNPTLEEETMERQQANFGNNKAWVAAYQRLASHNEHHNVLVAIDPVTKSQLGWTLMCEPSSIIADDFAFLPLCPSGDKTGLIACVGVDKSARGKGVGLALLVKAMENMRERGIEGVLIDWVVIRGFYETLGFEPIWHYEGYEWCSRTL